MELADNDRLRASASTSLGGALYKLGRYEDALGEFEAALALRRKALGPEHPDMAFSLSNLGLALKELGRYEKSHRMYSRALRLREKKLGADHPRVATMLENLGNLLVAMDRYEEARQLGERSQSVRLKVLARSTRTLPSRWPPWATRGPWPPRPWRSARGSSSRWPRRCGRAAGRSRAP
ncbi:tetratricopeptide repeat protein [Hyalangium gracile]|uniref:tetratricopeptide repeat protein n=1 Tax=Hyalangium gracile TaxID=394092 RepID=UPI001CC9F4BD|nr:tetratricopeptide repeat protein [Hyalangium gracile]